VFAITEQPIALIVNAFSMLFFHQTTHAQDQRNTASTKLQTSQINWAFFTYSRVHKISANTGVMHLRPVCSDGNMLHQIHHPTLFRHFPDSFVGKTQQRARECVRYQVIQPGRTGTSTDSAVKRIHQKTGAIPSLHEN
jgi:hypothetical protein